MKRRAICTIILIVTLVSPALTVSAAAPPSPHVTAVVLVIDTSGSMNNDWRGGVKLHSAKTAINGLLNLMIEESRLPDREYHVAVIEFADRASLITPLTSDLAQVRKAVNSLTAWGYTNIGAGLQLAYRQLERHQFDRGFIILLSDGVTNRGLSSSQILNWLSQQQSPQASVYGIDFTIRTDVHPTRAAGDINTIPLANHAASIIAEANIPTTTYTNSTSSAALRSLPADTLFAFYGHANFDRLAFIDATGSKTLLVSSDVSRQPPLPLRLAVLAGCLTADDRRGTSIAQTFLNQGAGCVVGFSETVNWIGYQHWSHHFWNSLAAGNNIYDAARIGTIRSLLGQIVAPIFSHKLSSRVVRTLPSAAARNLTLADIAATPTRHPVYTVGFAEHHDLDEQLLQAIAQITQGLYFYGGDASRLQDLFLITQHDATGNLIGEFEGVIYPDETITVGTLTVEPSTSELRVSINWPGSHIDLLLRDPMGRIVTADYPGVVIFRTERPGYVVIERPTAGNWQVDLFGTDVSPTGTKFHLAASTTDAATREASLLETLVVCAIIALVAVIFMPFFITATITRRETVS